jgi:GTPase SAR1 family protein
MEFGTRIIHIADKAIKLQIWDTAGQVSDAVVAVCRERLGL